MSTFQSQCTILHAESGLAVGSAIQRNAVEDAFSQRTVNLTTSAVSLDKGDVDKIRQILVKLTSGDDVQISTDNGSTYPMVLSGPGDATVFGLDSRTTSFLTTTLDIINTI